MSVVNRSAAIDNGHESDESTENAKLLGQLDACVQLMQRGSLLLVFHTQGVRMAFFNVSADGNSLHWDYVEENEEGDVVPVDATRTHVLLLRTVVDVSPNNSLASLSSNDVFALRITVQDGGELNIIAPSKTDFAVWFYGLAFLQRLMNSSDEPLDQEAQEGGDDDTQSNGPSSSAASSEDVRRLIHQTRDLKQSQEEDSDGYLEGNDGAVEPPRFDSEASSEQYQQDDRDNYENDAQDEEDDGNHPSVRSGCSSHEQSTGIDLATARRMLEQNQAQHQLIQSLMSENQQLQEMKRQKDQAIQRLLGDIKELRSEGAASEAMHASGESDVNQLRREVTVLKRHRQMLLSIIDVKDKCLADLWTMLCDVLTEEK